VIATALGLDHAEVALITCAAHVHDVGKIIVSPEILEKPGSLAPCEFEEIQRHAVFGARLVASLGDPELTAIVRHHHERLDGSGYPDRRRGEEIPLGARVVGVADTFDALTSCRPYREPRSPAEALRVIEAEAGVTFDRKVVAAFVA
jgi:HD-GYP domain-containing protein (c-di-GMP phosphodiesterase class II)